MKIEENLKKLITATRENKISWTRVNPTTYSWKKQASDGSNINTVVQKRNIKDGSSLIFRLWDLDRKTSMLDVKYEDSDSELKSLLQELYESISGNALHMNDIFTDLLKDL